MHCPSHLCNALYRLRPDLRWGWAGREKTTEEEASDQINVGDFCLVQLMPNHIVGPKEAPWVFSTLWDVEPRMCDDGVNNEMRKIERGPVFNRSGGTRPDWDPLFQTPIYITNMGQMGFGKERVLSGEAMSIIPGWFSPMRKRMKASMEAKYRDHKRVISERSKQMTDDWWAMGNKTGETSPLMTWKEAKPQVEYMYKRAESRNLANGYYKMKDML